MQNGIFVNRIHNVIEYVKDKYVDKWAGSVPENFKIPLHDGDIEKSGNITFKNCYYLNAKSKDAPQIVDQNVKPVVNHGELYSGCYGNVSMIFYAYNHCGNKDINVWLGNIQKVREVKNRVISYQLTNMGNLISGIFGAFGNTPSRVVRVYKDTRIPIKFGYCYR